MRYRNVYFLWQEPLLASEYRTGVCLHGHTMYSRECLDFLPRYLKKLPGVAQIVDRYERPGTGKGTDFAHAYWTPPLTPAAAAQLEQAQIGELGLDALVSLTDHDSIEACVALQLTGGRNGAPISVEWTVPYEKAILHIGVHNLPGAEAQAWMGAMAAFTADPDETKLPEMLSALAALPEVLVVLNHPFWLEEGVIEANRERAVARLQRECSSWIHALELNGTRSWKENRDTIELSKAWDKPVLSGGDRHACEPAACINLTQARTFCEFAAEIKDGRSVVGFMPHYRESMAARILEMSWDILRPYPEYAGREFWTDRIFYTGEDGVDRTLSAIWKNGAPWISNGVTATLGLFATTRLRSAVRLFLLRRGEILF